MQETINELKKAYNDSLLRNKEVFIHIDTNNNDAVLPDSIKNTGDEILNISPSAVRMIDFGPKYLEFFCTFNGIVKTISIPYEAIICLIERSDNG